MIEGLVEQFTALDDPRCPGKVEHWLVDVLVIAVCTIMAEGIVRLAACLAGLGSRGYDDAHRTLA